MQSITNGRLQNGRHGRADSYILQGLVLLMVRGVRIMPSIGTKWVINRGRIRRRRNHSSLWAGRSITSLAASPCFAKALPSQPVSRPMSHMQPGLIICRETGSLHSERIIRGPGNLVRLVQGHLSPGAEARRSLSNWYRPTFLIIDNCTGHARDGLRAMYGDCPRRRCDE
jgi:hypothetical protein